MTLMLIQCLTASLFLPSLLLPLVDAVRLDADTPKWQKWAPYRPGLYFGVRPNIPETLLMGLMWANGTDKNSLVDSKQYLRPRPSPCRRTRSVNMRNY